MLVTDVDLFKDINDTYGHDGGDEALVFVAGLLKEVAGDSGYPIRFGGDEFMVLVTEDRARTSGPARAPTAPAHQRADASSRERQR